MATVSKWTPFGVALDLTATGSSVTRTSATQFTVKINASWETYYENAQTDYGMDVTSGGVTKTISTQGTKRSSGSGSFTGTYSISGNGSATKTITVTFKNYNTWAEKSATKNVTFNVTVPAWASYVIGYNANGGTGAPATQIKWKDQTLTLSTTKPTRTGYTFQGWAVGNNSTVSYQPGGKYTGNVGMTLYAVWKANTYTVSYNANGGSGAPGSQTKTYGVTLKLSSTVPTRTNYKFKGWGTSASTKTVSYAAGANYTANAGAVLYAVWELAYTKPAITAVTVERGGHDPDTGKWVPSDSGTMAMVEFDWDTFLDVESIVISVESVGSKTQTYTLDSTSGTSNTVTYYIGDDSPLNTDSTYTVKITVSDANGSTTLTRTIPGMKFAIDFLAGGTGASVGKPAELSGYFDVGYKTRLRDILEVDNRKQFYSYAPDGTRVEFIHPMNENGNVVIGYGNYDRGEGNTNVYGYDVHIGISSIDEPGYYRPYRRKGDSVNFTLRTSGYVTNGGKDVSFTVPFAVPIVGIPTVTVSSLNGFTLRQGNNYTHGSSATAYVSPDSYSAVVSQWMGVTITASFTNTTNVTNNDAIGIYWNGTITFT